ncbi:trans-sialidase, putative [Trypanosoma cruzi marinkellei]|uniref:Trans-sialidase, putative n=1 Tax=Trypanosoma cruzi marinkellei TaxID=85056 RepID=K2MAN9_TRYCR|nr:trans-sialidase, putative [Trypanosoma cruzi marinkellei]
MTACDDGRRRVYRISDKGESWMEALGTLSRVWGNKQGESGVRSGFTTATIGGGDGNNRKVMLVTLPVYSSKNGKEDNVNGRLHLWLTDNTHIVDIGPVSSDEENVTASSLLYNSGTNNEELIALYEKKKSGGESSHSLWSVLLTEQLQRVKDVLATWKKADDIVSKLCLSSIAAVSAPTTNVCSAGKVTAGLVGFLSGNFSGNTWRDEYLGVNATVNNNDGAKETSARATGLPYGVKFTGLGAGAEWPVGKQGENQLYHFANYNFTLVATVSIHNVPKSGSVPLMGAVMNGTENTVLLGLSYSSEKKWNLLCGDKNAEQSSNTWEAETTYQVAIVLQNGTQGTAYVDGKRVGEQCAVGNIEDKRISHFYIGGDGGSAGSEKDVSVTVKNVLLYNRQLDETEIKALNANKVSIPKLKKRKTEVGDASSAKVSAPATQGTVSSSIPPQDRDVNAAALSSSLGNVSHGKNSDATTVRESGLLPSLLLLLLGLWGFAAL